MSTHARRLLGAMANFKMVQICNRGKTLRMGMGLPDGAPLNAEATWSCWGRTL